MAENQEGREELSEEKEKPRRPNPLPISEAGIKELVRAFARLSLAERESAEGEEEQRQNGDWRVLEPALPHAPVRRGRSASADRIRVWKRRGSRLHYDRRSPEQEEETAAQEAQVHDEGQAQAPQAQAQGQDESGKDGEGSVRGGGEEDGGAEEGNRRVGNDGGRTGGGE